MILTFIVYFIYLLIGYAFVRLASERWFRYRLKPFEFDFIFAMVFFPLVMLYLLFKYLGDMLYTVVDEMIDEYIHRRNNNKYNIK